MRGSRALGRLAAASLALPGWATGAWAQTSTAAPDLLERLAADAPPVSAVTPFVLASDDPSRPRALQCLTQAIYYEAATEPREGQEAVAQVVLNRMRHPGFPKSVCGVVFEGSERSTGCQFTFTCDGSLARRPVSWRWAAAGQVASAALDGYVDPDIGASTHYHTAWVSPVWDHSMVVVRRVGAHIFYRMPGAQGSPEALTGQYAGAEPSTDAPDPIAAAAPPANTGAPPPVPGASQFSVWGLPVATLASRQGHLVVREDPSEVPAAATP